MPIKEKTRKFNFSYGELLQQSLEKSTFFRRDASTLALRGITSNDLDVFDDLITAFKETKEDIIFTGLISDATQSRDEKRKQLEILGRDLLGIAETVFKSKSGIYASFGFTNLSKMNDGEILLAAETLYSKVQEYTAALTPRGLTPAMITELRTVLDEFEPLVKYLVAAKSDRDLNTSNRYTISNNLYSTMIELCLIAANYFQDRDAGKYSDYVIYGSSTTSQTRSGTLNPKSIVSRTFTGLTPETVLKLKNEGTGSLDFYFSTTEGGNPISAIVTVPAYQEHIHTVNKLGYDVPTGSIKLNIRNLNETEISSYLIRIE
jgi:hypothetical protein